MILCIDSGNSRIKWGLAEAEGDAWLASGTLAHCEVAQLAVLVEAWPKPARLLLANVAGTAAEQAIRGALGSWGEQLECVRSTAQAAGVSNGYRTPERLGVDRWCALIGARELSAEAQLVVMAGTATTVDSLDAQGRFLGGLILPGQQLMLQALARDTAGLPLADGDYALWPQCTEDAIVSGAIEAQAGAIERAWQRLPGKRKDCLISGGAAITLASHLSLPCRIVDNLPLRGLRLLARASC